MSYVVESTSGAADCYDLYGGILAINNRHAIWQLKFRDAKLALASDVQRSIIGEGNIGVWVLSSKTDVDEEVLPLMMEV